jgi:hypothetical protein
VRLKKKKNYKRRSQKTECEKEQSFARGRDSFDAVPGKVNCCDRQKQDKYPQPKVFNADKSKVPSCDIFHIFYCVITMVLFLKNLTFFILRLRR